MSHYSFPQEFRAVHDHAVGLYAEGRRGAETFFNDTQLAWLAGNGLAAQAFYDYAEDQANYSEPGFEHALTIETVRRDYFLNVQGGVASSQVADSVNWPSKDAQTNGIVWLPRILPKARAKLRGELPTSMMYCCGGDRRFLKANDLLPAEFLALVWRHENDDAGIIAWVTARHAAVQAQ